VTLLSRAIGSGLAVKVKNFMLFHALVVDTVKMTHGVILRFFYRYSFIYPCKFNGTFREGNWTSELALPPNGNVKELFFIASLNIKSGAKQTDLSGKSQTKSAPPPGSAALDIGSPFVLMLFPSIGVLG